MIQDNNINKVVQDIACPHNHTFVLDLYDDGEDRSNVNRPKSTNQLIPRVIYQTSKSRCMTPDFTGVLNKWKNPVDFPGFSYRLYDDEAMDDFLFNKERWEHTFPSLHLALQCINKGHNPTMKADIWRYLVLWEYGGVYADIDVAPGSFNASSIHPDDDGFFYVENKAGYLAQFFLAVSPHHPLMFYAVHAAVRNLLVQREFAETWVAQTTGPRALAHAMMAFMNDATAGRKITHTVHIGEDDRSIRVAGVAKKHLITNHLGNHKLDAYAKMNMTHYTNLNKGKPRTGTCYDMMNATKTRKGFEYEGVKVEPLDIKPKL